jgi:hypothetical protein
MFAKITCNKRSRTLDGTIASAELTVCTTEGAKTIYNLEPGQLVAVFRILGLPQDEASPIEDPLYLGDLKEYSAELEAQDPYFTREEQKELVRRAAAVDKGEVIRFDPLREPAEVGKARLEAFRKARQNG